MSAATKILMGSGAVDLPSDDEFDNVSFLSHFDGSNNGTNSAYDDGSASNHTITTAGTPPQGTFSPFARVDGEWSNYFALGGDALTFTNDATMSWDGDFTIELFCNVGTIATEGSTNPSLLLIGSIQLYLNATSGSPNFVALHVGGADIVESAADSITTGVWHHIAIVRSGSGTNNLSLYLNGTRVDQVTNTATLGGSSGTSRIGNYAASPAGGINGYMSNVRILKGTALYSGSSITVPTSALTAITNTKLLTCQSNRFIDNSSTGFSLTVVETPRPAAFTPILTSKVYDSAVNGAGAYFNGSSDYLTLASSADFGMGTGNFTWEAWIYQTYRHGSLWQQLFSTDNYSTGNNISIWLTSSGTVAIYYVGGSSSFTTTSSFPINTWTHIAIVRKGTGTNEFSIYINGVAGITGTMGTDFPDDGITIARHGSGTTNYYYGYISDFRIVKGTAVYTGNFTPPTAPLTAITNTKLLLNMADGQAIDSAAQNNITLVANADTSTSQKKFGTASLAFDGTGDYVTLPYESFAPFGTGNFTIEGWVYFTANDNGGGVFQLSNGYLNSQVRGPTLGLDGSSDNWRWYYGTSSASHGSVGPSVDTWYHFAWVRNSGTSKVYIDGTEILTASDATNYTDTYFTIGAYYNSSLELNGYIDEFRISHVARYTSNFTPTTEVFPDKGQ